MKEEDSASEDGNAGVLYAPWEKTFEKVLTPIEEFIHRETTSGLLLMASAVAAMIVANGVFAQAYLHLIHMPIRIGIGEWMLEETLHHWINDGLMALFFFVVGMELKREILVGELSDLRRAALPILAAIGGMVVPALVYLAFNPGGESSHGWGVPMATDIAFAVGALALLANRVPQSLITFLVALAIVDDLGAVLVIALFYTREIATEWLAIAAAILGALVVLNLAGIRGLVPYFILAIVLWYALLLSGVHATLAGVLGAFTVPARSKVDAAFFRSGTKNLIDRFDRAYRPGITVMTSDALHGIVQAFEDNVAAARTPLQRLEHIWHLPVAFVVIPVFAFANAGIPLQLDSLTDALVHPVTQGVIIGLVLGKFVGISAATWLALRFGVGRLPAGTRFSQIVGVALLGGIGFTMSIFIAELGFVSNPEYLAMAKTGVLLASLVGGISGLIWLWAVAPRE